MEKKVTREEVERVLDRHTTPGQKEYILNELFLPESDSVNYKLKHLSKYCCEPKTPAEFEYIKEVSLQEGVKWYSENKFSDTSTYPFLFFDIDDGLIFHSRKFGTESLSVLDFINKLRMSEEEVEKLEDDRVVFFDPSENKNCKFLQDYKTLIALNGHYFKTNKDGTEVTLRKRD